MAELRLGPLLRYVDTTDATVWVETDRPCEVEVVCEDPAGDGPPAASGSSRTWRVAGHHYALVPVTGLTPGTSVPYRVLLDGEPVWPLPESGFPPSTVHTLPEAADDATVRVAFGSCRWAAPPAAGDDDPVGPDALDTLAAHLARDPRADRPDVLLLLGDQVYADEVSPDTRRHLAGRRTGRPGDAPADQVADYEEYTHLYHEGWLDPEVRWLLSTVPSCMVFDDHDVIDDWNTSQSWLAAMRREPWWQERIIGGFASYWVHQHLGNLSPAELAADAMYAAVREAGAFGDAHDLLREFARRAETDPASVRWSYRRDFGRVRLLMVDTRAGRVLEESERRIVDDGEMEWLREQSAPDGSFDHLLIGSSLPWLLPHAMHDTEAWNAALCAGERGPRWARVAERLRRAGDLEHWAAFTASFDALADLVTRVGATDGDNGDDGNGGSDTGAAPATVCVLSGDVHHAYVAEARRQDGRPLRSRVFQLTCSPVHNSVPAALRLSFRFGWSRGARWIGRALRRHGRAATPPMVWRKEAGPFFGNQVMTLALTGRTARLRLYRARVGARGPRLATVMDEDLTPVTVPGTGIGAGPAAVGAATAGRRKL